MTNLQKAKISILLVTVLDTRPSVEEVITSYKTEFNEDITFNDAEDCLISLQYDNETEHEEAYLKYLEMKT
jgi:hypothetical protein